MKAVVNEIEKKETDFPKLMVSETGNIVLFQVFGSGVLVSSDGNREDVGELTNAWDMTVFRDFKGTVTLSND